VAFGISGVREEPLVLALLGGLAAHATPLVFPTGDTSPPDSGVDTGDSDVAPVDTDTDTDTDTDIPPTVDSGVLIDTSFCAECLTAAELANEQGGGPCEEGCSSIGAGGASTAMALLTAAFLLLRRPR